MQGYLRKWKLGFGVYGFVYGKTQKSFTMHW